MRISSSSVRSTAMLSPRYAGLHRQLATEPSVRRTSVWRV
jgi:hypothetical protein